MPLHKRPIRWFGPGLVAVEPQLATRFGFQYFYAAEMFIRDDQEFGMYQVTWLSPMKVMEGP
ncbi:hypothetical protein SAMN05216315_12032 [Nitrosospira sp. Nsp18]|nr:hypothetical protein SAMN05216315_12032 [Nitrosospira sp. Nsp18]